VRRSVLILLLVALASTALLAQPDPQQPRPPRRDEQGLLKINSLYYELSASTGGDFYFWAPGEFAAAAPVDIPSGGDEVVLAYGSLSGATTTFEIPVESEARSLTIFCGIQRQDLAVVVRPDDRPLRPGDAGVRVQTFQHMTIATIAAPGPGTWRLELTGSGIYSVSARLKAGSNAPSLDAFEFVELRGRPGHEGLFPIERAPKRGETLDARAELGGRVSEVDLSFVAADGTPLGRCPVVRKEETWLGSCGVPDRPFRAVVTGIDTAGRRFRRIGTALITPE
jgi:hypothetical protein